MQLKIDPELHALIPPLSAEERAELRASLQAEGCRDKLIAWGDIIIDGHNRFDLCAELGIPYEVDRREFVDRDAAMLWMIRNQFARRNLPSYVRAQLASKAKPLIAAAAKQRQATSTGGSAPQLRQNSDEAEPISTKHELATLAGVSHDTIHKVETVERDAPEPIKEKARAGEISTNRAYQLTKRLGELPEKDRAKAGALSDDSDTKVATLVRLHKTAGSPESNGTYDEILSTGGFHYGDDLDKWCDFANDSVEQIEAALKSIAKHHAREGRLAKQAARAELARSFPPDVFNVIYADPPWQYQNDWVNGAADDHYLTMEIEEICDYLKAINLQLADNAVLFMWVTNPFIVKALRVIEAWGFEYKTNMVWYKTELKKPGAGFYVRGRHELLFIGTRGSMTPLVDVAPPIGSVIMAPIQDHSRKPDEVHDIIERLYPDCNYVELFARTPREGWLVWGDEVRA